MAKRNANIKIKVENLPGILEKIELLTAERDDARAERDRYRLAWQNARQRARTRTVQLRSSRQLKGHCRDELTAARDELAAALAALQRVRAHVAEWAARDCIAGNRWFDWEGNVHHVACFHCAAAEMTRTLDGEATDA